MALFDFAWDEWHGYTLRTNFRTQITEWESGKEQRAAIWATPRRAWDLYFHRDAYNTSLIVSFFEARMGAYEAFQWRDPFGILRNVRFLEDSLECRILHDVSVIQVTLVEVLDEDTVPPTVSSVSPGNGANSNGLNVNVIWQMSKVIRPIDACATYFHVVDSSTGLSVPGALILSAEGTQIIFDPADQWVEGRLYLPRVEAGVHDLANNQLVAAYGSRFMATV